MVDKSQFKSDILNDLQNLIEENKELKKKIAKGTNVYTIQHPKGWNSWTHNDVEKVVIESYDPIGKFKEYFKWLEELPKTIEESINSLEQKQDEFYRNEPYKKIIELENKIHKHEQEKWDIQEGNRKLIIIDKENFLNDVLDELADVSIWNISHKIAIIKGKINEFRTKYQIR